MNDEACEETKKHRMFLKQESPSTIHLIRRMALAADAVMRDLYLSCLLKGINKEIPGEETVSKEGMQMRAEDVCKISQLRKAMGKGRGLGYSSVFLSRVSWVGLTRRSPSTGTSKLICLLLDLRPV